jgi:hypothetical protein
VTFSIQNLKAVTSTDETEETRYGETPQLFGTDRDIPFSVSLFTYERVEPMGTVITTVYS